MPSITTFLKKNTIPTLDGTVIVSQRHLLSTIWRFESGRGPQVCTRGQKTGLWSKKGRLGVVFKVLFATRQEEASLVLSDLASMRWTSRSLHFLQFFASIRASQEKYMTVSSFFFLYLLHTK